MLMKSRHAVALALVGWYLLTPIPQIDPATHLPTGDADLSVPFRYWTNWGIFDSAKKCEAEIQRQIHLNLQNDAKLWSRQSDQEKEAIWEGMDKAEKLPKGWNHALHGSNGFGATSALNARCVATDDPRLKEKSDVPPLSTW
jgi:beta-glucosidase-like glycosyl hydrolase